MSETDRGAKFDQEAMRKVAEKYRDQFLEIGVEIVATKIKEEAPVDTGNLKNSTFTEFSTGSETARVKNSAEYCTYVEFGTKFMSPNPFMSRGMELAKPYLMKLIREIARANP